MTPAATRASEVDDVGETRASTRHAGIERDDVVATALRIVEESGADALSMRKLAAELGVTATTIYWHVGSRDDVVIAAIQLLAERQAEAPVTGTTPRRRVMSAARNIWSNALAHRNVTALANQVGATTLLELPLEAALVAELEAAGVRGEATRDALRAILACVAGFLVMAWRRDDTVPAELQPAQLWAQLDDPRLDPKTVAVLTESPDLDALFETTMSAIVDTFVPARRKRSSR
jgi:AcrR family transcriptional regulator